jgi:hypothetical protein
LYDHAIQIEEERVCIDSAPMMVHAVTICSGGPNLFWHKFNDTVVESWQALSVIRGGRSPFFGLTVPKPKSLNRLQSNHQIRESLSLSVLRSALFLPDENRPVVLEQAYVPVITMKAFSKSMRFRFAWVGLSNR